MTNELPLEQTVEPIELVLEGSVEPKEPVDHLEILEESIEMDESMGKSVDHVELFLEEPDEIEEVVQIELLEPLSLSMDGFEQPELPIANNLKQKVEAVLYLKGQPMNLAAIAEALGCEIEDAEMGLIDLITEYAHRDSALEIMETDVGFSLRLRSEFEDLVHKLIPVDLGRGVFANFSCDRIEKKYRAVRVDRVARCWGISARSGVSRAGICEKEKASRWGAIVGFASNHQVSSIF